MAYVWDKTNPLVQQIELPNKEGEEIIVIDSNLRNIAIPTSLKKIGVAGDHNCESIFFQIPRYFDGNDLAQHQSLIRYINAGKEYGEYKITDMAVDDDFIILGWRLTNQVTRYAGMINFTVQFETVGYNGVTYQWQTVPAQLFIMAALPVESTITEKDDSLYRNLVTRIEELEARIVTLDDLDDWKEHVDNNTTRIKYLEDNVVYALFND